MSLTPDLQLGWLREHLLDEILPLWIERAPTPSGLFRCRFGRKWEALPGTAGTLVSQSRLLYNFAQGWALTRQSRYLDAIRSGAAFLLERFADREMGGWHWSVEPDGTVVNTDKESYGHAFLIFGLANAARAASDAALADAAGRAWKLVRTRFADGRGGFWRRMTRDFRPRDERRSQNPIMHLFEALLDLGDLPGSEHVHADARAVADFVLGRLVRPADGILPEFFDADWRELPAASGGRIVVGHQLEWAFLLSRAAERGLGQDLLAPAERMLAGGMRLGFDAADGGVFREALPGGEPRSGRKIWWEQCELVRALLHFAVVRGRGDLVGPLQRSAAFVRERFLDHEFGGWFAETGPGCGPEAQHKGGLYKLDYHAVAMCAEAIRLLNRA